ncbi:MAG: hypothetical protein RMK29_09300 [Myxococcales bacterium]|nr:hypothetical protein [Myxococcota bacterium]MDW8281895.1 hypothetical protein [Myxococcales bacterium]
MGLRLLDVGDEEHVLEMADWNARPTLGLLLRSGVLGLAAQVQLEESGSVEVDERQARALARYLQQEVLAGMGPCDWIDASGTRTTEPDEAALQRLAMTRRDHLERASLERLAAFCQRCAGFLLS